VWIDVTFEINADGIVNVTARDRETGAQASTRITLSSGLSERELERILEERRTERVRTAGLPAAGREVLGSVRLVPTPVRAAPEARERRARTAPAVPAAEAATDELPALGSAQGLAIAPGDDAPELELPEGDADPLLEVSPGASGAAAARVPPPPSDEELLDASLEASASLFDDGDDAPELTAPEPSPLDGTTPDTSLFESPGSDLSTSQRGARPRS
jgi:molecular chaperone DnaK